MQIIMLPDLLLLTKETVLYCTTSDRCVGRLEAKFVGHANIIGDFDFSYFVLDQKNDLTLVESGELLT